ncbi:MAG TPA: EamA family transporter [Marmoricola sp.]|nr:EamA family transporter [Marmoricola sp.]
MTAVAPVAWGSNYYVTHEFLPQENPVWGAALRALPAGLLLLAAGRRLPTGAWWWRAAVLGLLNTSAFFVLIYLAAQLLPTSVAATVMATSPVAMMGVAWLALNQPPRPMQLLGAAAGIAGVALMLLTGAADVQLLGVLASVAAMVMSAVGFVLTKKWATDVPALDLASWQLTAGGLALVPFAVLLEGAPPTIAAAEASAFAYVAVVATALAFVAWFTGLQRLDAGSVGLVGLLNPVTGVLLGTALAHEVLTGRQLAGIALVLGGIVVGQRTPRRTAGAPGMRKRPERVTMVPAPTRVTGSEVPIVNGPWGSVPSVSSSSVGPQQIGGTQSRPGAA